MLTLERLKEVLDYNPDTGVFVWKNTYHNIRNGFIAGCLCNGYITIGVDGKIYYAHRLAWFYVYGVWPEHQIDHKDHNKENNSIYNLRDVTQSGNLQNQIKSRSDNKTTGLLGASFNKRRNIYDAQICLNGKCKHLGSFNTAAEAHAAYITAKRQFHSTCTL